MNIKVKKKDEYCPRAFGTPSSVPSMHNRNPRMTGERKKEVLKEVMA